jgi:cobalt/nickel transport system permease protein
MCEGHDELNAILYGHEASHSAPNGSELLTTGRWSRQFITCETMLGLALGALVANLTTHSPLFSLSLALASLALLTRLGVAPSRVVKRLAILSYFSLVAIATPLFLSGQTVLLQIGPLVAYQEGLVQGILLGSKMIGGSVIVLLFGTAVGTPRVSALLATSSTSPWQELAAKLRLPPVLIDIAVLIYRYLFLLAEETERIRQAQLTRLGHRNHFASVKSYGILFGMVVVRSYDRAERVQEAMTLRGQGGATIVSAFTGRDIPGLIVVATAAAIFLWLGQTL